MTSPERAEVLDKIKGRGHWRLTLFPPHSPQPVIALSEGKRLLSASAVDLTGWDYPHIPTINNDSQRALYSVGNEFVEGVTDFQKYKEILRLYETGLVAHVAAFWEDWIAEEPWIAPTDPIRNTPPGSVLDFLSVNLKVTEMLMFAKNLVAGGPYSEGIALRLELRGVKGRHLGTLDRSRMPLRDIYACEAGALIYGPILLTVAQSTEAVHLEIATGLILKIYRAFNWDSVDEGRIKDDQQMLLQRRR